MRVLVRNMCENNVENRKHLERNRIPYDCINSRTLVFEIFSDDEAYFEVIYKVQGERLFEKAVYSKKEIMQSEWLLMRSKCAKITSADDEHTFSYSCDQGKLYGKFNHRTQEREYVVGKQVAWKNKNNFYSADTDFQTLFCSEYAKKQLLENHVKGIEFESVLLKKTMLPADDLFQLRFNNILPRGSLVLPINIKTIKCDQCGKEQIYIPEPNNFSLGVKSAYLTKESDAFFTEDLFGEGFGYHLLVVSQKFYEIITGMCERNIVFTPINVE